MPYGFQVHPRRDVDISPFLDRLRRLSTPDLSDAMHSSGTMAPQIRPMSLRPGRRVIGPAVTISVPTASVPMMRVGLDTARSGDVVVVNSCANETATLVGGNMLRSMSCRGVAGFIADGAVRDISELREGELPVFARGVTIRGGPNGPDAGEVNVPIACGNVVVNPGDIIVADEDGIVVIPVAHLADVVDAATAIERKHQQMQESILQGNVYALDEAMHALEAAGCETVGR